MPAIIVPGLYLMLAGICAYAGLIHAAAGLARPRDWSQLLFAALCGAVLLCMLTFAAMMWATTPAALGALLKLNLSFVGVFYLLLPWFITSYTARRAPLALGALTLLGLLAQVVNLVLPHGMQFAEVTGLGLIRLPWGEEVHMGAMPLS